MLDIINWLNTYLGNPILEMRSTYAVAVVGAAIIALVCCLFGYRRVRIIGAVIGFVAGALVGNFIGKILNLTFPIDLAAVVILAIVVAILGFFLVRFSTFITVFVMVWGAVWSYLSKYTSIEGIFTVLIALVVGVILAILAVVYGKPMIITATACAGGLLFSSLICGHLVYIRWSSILELIVRVCGGVLMAVIGCAYQFTSSRYED